MELFLHPSSRVVLVGLPLVLAFTLFSTQASGIAGIPARAMSCFVISGTMTCIDTGSVPVAPVVPSVMGPVGPFFDGEDEEIIMRDNGGREVARG